VNIVGGVGGDNILKLQADTPSETWEIGVNPLTRGGPGPAQIQINVPNSLAKIIYATGLQTLSLDDSPLTANTSPPPQYVYPAGSEITYQVDDLAGTGISTVELNEHQETTPDTYADQVIINAPEAAEQVGVDSQANTTSEVYATGVYLTAGTASYDVYVTLPKAADCLSINALGGNDTITVGGTPESLTGGPGGQANIFTGGASNTINVTATIGPLDIFAQGRGDTVTLGAGADKVQGILGPVQVEGVVTPGVGETTSLILNDEKDFVAHTATVTAFSVTNLANGEITFSVVGTVTIDSGGLGVTAPGDTFNVQSTAAPL
jgi:hypothetical protein